jgi:uncharacterized membrane protein
VLSEAVAQLLRRQRELEERVGALESRDIAEQPAAVPPPLPLFEPSPTVEYGVQATVEPLETTIGLDWINRIAVVTLLLGAAFLFKYGVDNDWFGPGARVALGIAAAMISLAAGDRLWRRGQTVFAQGIVGLGLALLYLSIYAAAMLYHLLPPGFAFVAMCIVTAGAGWLALLYNSQAVAVIAMLGGYLTPAALSTGENHPWILFGYVFLLNFGAMLLARRRSWRALEPIAAAATIILYAGWFNQWFADSGRAVATVFAFAFYAQFSVATLPELWAVFQLGASVALALIWPQQAHFAWWNLAIVAGGLANAYRRDSAIAPVWTLASFWLPFWLWYTIDAPFAALSAAFLIFFGWALWRGPRRIAGLGLIAANAAIYYAASYTLLNPQHHQYMGLLAAAVGGVHLLLARHFEIDSDAQTLTLGVALAFVTLAIPIQFAGFRVTIAWALEGSVLAWLTARSHSNSLRLFCWSVLVLAAFRLLVFDSLVFTDASQYSALVNARFLTFAVAAASLWLAAYFLAPATDAAVAYVAGHAIFLFGLSLEIGGWVTRNVLPGNQSGVQIVAISMMLTTYAVLLVLIGIRTRAAIHRILGLALVVLVVAKLYAVDVWILGRLFRITAFLALGILLLALSYLYSRLRPALERLLRTDSSTSTKAT